MIMELRDETIMPAINGVPKSDRDVYIVSACRTPIGSLGGSLSSLTATQLASIAIRTSLERINLEPKFVEKVNAGQVLQAGCGQAPAKQALLGANIPSKCYDSLVNEVCASVGMESMSKAPRESLDGDGLIFNNRRMGDYAEDTAKKYHLTREDQDNYAVESYQRARSATETGLLAKEICDVEALTIVSEDEEFKRFDLNKMKNLKPKFARENGTITAANASSCGDGAAACVLMSSEAMIQHGVSPMARIVSFGENACDPCDFATSPVDAIRDALSKAGLHKEHIALWEINEAFSVVALANMKILDLDNSKVNKFGGGVSLGHPLGMSGIRIVNSLAHQLLPGQYGCAAICRGGGGSKAMIIEKL